MAFTDALKEENNQLFEAAPPLDDMFDGVCDIFRGAVVADNSERDGVGNLPITTIELANNLPCTIQPQTSFSRFKEVFQGHQIVKYEYIAYIKVRSDNLDIDFIPKARDTIKNYINNGVDQGLTYNVMSVLSDGGGTRHWFLGCDVVTQ
jgi:hypothetical protein